MGSAGCAYDNAMCESFLATLRCGIHSAIGYTSPANFEELNHAA